MPAEFTISSAAVFGVAGFLFQIGLVMASVFFSYGALKEKTANQDGKIEHLERRQEEHIETSLAVARLQTEMEAVNREMKGLREEFRRVMDELINLTRLRSARAPP